MVSIVGLAALLLSLFIIFIIFILLRTKKKKSKKDFKPEGFINEPNQKLEDTVVYEEIDDHQQNPQIIHISKNMAYFQFHGTKSIQTPKNNMEEMQ